MISNQHEEKKGNGSKITITHNGRENFEGEQNYTYQAHLFKVNTQTPSEIAIIDVLDCIKMPNKEVNVQAKCDSKLQPGLKINILEQGFHECDICNKSNKYRYVFRFIGPIKFSSKITIPEWEDINIAGPVTTKRWNEWLDNLKTHENGHWDIDVEYAKKCKAWADKINGIQYIVEVCCGNNKVKAKQKAMEMESKWREELDQKMTSELQSLWTEHNSKQEQYDKDTNHGATQGVGFGAYLMETIDK